MKQTNTTKKYLAKVLAESFFEDPLYEYMLPDKKTRQEAMNIFFEVYLDIFAPYGDLIVDSKKVNSVAYIYYENRFKKPIRYKVSLLKAAIKGIKLLRVIGYYNFKRILATVKNTSSEWIFKYVKGDYIHVDLIGVKKVSRGEGKGTEILRYAIQEANRSQLPLTLETQNQNNLALYEKMGFKIVNTFRYKGLTQYCMIYRPSSK